MVFLGPWLQGFSQAAIKVLSGTVFSSQGSTRERSVFALMIVGRCWFFMGYGTEDLSFLLTVGWRSP